MRKVSVVFGVFALLSVATLLAANGQLNGVYWEADRSTPQTTLREAVNAIRGKDYFRLYALVSPDVISSLNKDIIRYSPDIWGIKIDLADILISEYGQRYGKIAVFEKLFLEMSTIPDSWVHYMQVGDVVGELTRAAVKKSVRKNGKEIAEVAFNNISFTFVDYENGWYLDNARYGSTTWRE